MRALNLLRNARIVVSTVHSHAGDDPVLLVLQVSRRVSPGVLRRAAAVGRVLLRPMRRRLPFVWAFVEHLGGQDAALEQLLNSGAAQGNLRPATCRRLAELALATGNTVQADRLLERGGASAPGTSARRLWYDGDMSGAVTVLHAAGRTRHEQRLAAELKVFEGWSPRLPPVGSYSPAPRTVLHLLTNSLPHTGSGYAQRSHSILTAQRAQGWQVHAVTRIGYPVQVGRLLARDADVVDGVTYHRLLPGKLARGYDSRLQQQAEEVLALALRLKPAVLHTTTHFINGLVAAEVARVLGIPWVYEVRGQLADTWASSRSAQATASERYKLFTDRETQVMRNANLVVTLGEAMKREIMLSGVSAEKVLLTPNAVGDEYLEPPISSAEARKRLGLEAAGTYVGTVSSLVDYEGLDTLLHAVARLAPSVPGLRCLIVGDGVAAPGLKSLAGRLGITDRVVFTGRVPREEARTYHQALDIFVVPRKDLDVTRSVTPLKPVEAMACARPVIASNLPALREIVVESVTGVLVKPEAAEDLAAAISGLMTVDGFPTPRAQAWGAAGRSLVLERRTWALNAERYATSYARIGVAV